METQNIDKVLKVLGGLSTKELEVVKNTISGARRRKLPILKMNILISAQETGQEMFFKDSYGKPHIGKIKKINQKFVRLYDERTKKIFNILPEELSVPTDADRHAIDQVNQERATTGKRQYIRRKAIINKSNIKMDEKGNVVYGRRKGD